MQAGRWHENSFLGRLRADIREEFLKLGFSRSYEPGEALFHMGDRTKQVFVLLTGRVRVLAETEDGKVALLAIRLEGELVGELAGLDGEPRSATVTAAQDKVEVRVISPSEFHQFIETHPQIGLAISRNVSAKLRWATRRRLDFNEPVPVRLARILYELAQQYGVRSGADVVTVEPFTQPDLAAFVGAAEPSTQKALADLRRLALIDTGYRSVTIRDMAGLRIFARLSSGT